MTSFLDGPAVRASLMLKNAPFYLRVTHDGTTWDALNYPEDVARPNEKLFAYQRSAVFGTAHVRMKRGSGFFVMASYRFILQQPDDATLRDNAKWAAWVETQPKPTE